MKDFFKVLSVPRTAALDDVKKAYRSLAKQWHPDKNSAPEAGERFREIAEAYECLKEDNQRELHKQRLENIERTPAAAPSTTKSNPYNASGATSSSFKPTSNSQQPKYTFEKASDDSKKGRRPKSQWHFQHGTSPNLSAAFAFFKGGDEFFASRDFFQEIFSDFRSNDPLFTDSFETAFDAFFSASMSSGGLNRRGSVPTPAATAAPKTRAEAAAAAKLAAAGRKWKNFDVENEFDDDLGGPSPPLPNPRGRFASRTRKGEEGFVSFGDDNPGLLLKCKFCDRKVAAEKWNQHERTCTGVKASPPPMRPVVTISSPSRPDVIVSLREAARKGAFASPPMTPPQRQFGGVGNTAPAPKPSKFAGRGFTVEDDGSDDEYRGRAATFGSKTRAPNKSAGQRPTTSSRTQPRQQFGPNLSDDD